MARRKIEDKNIRNIQQSHGSYYISIPVSIMRSFKWQERQKVVVRRYGKNKVLIEDWKK